MRDHNLGILLALGACVLWSLSPFFFTSTGRRIGPFATNLLRLLLATVLLAIACAVQWIFLPRIPLPGWHASEFLVLSGVVGLFVGDIFLYQSLFKVGPERTSLLMTLSPAVTAALAWIFLDERLSLEQLLGMAMVLGGVAGAVWPKKFPHPEKKAGSHVLDGILAAVIQGFGSILARQAFLVETDLSPVFATTVRVGAGTVAILLAAIVTGRLIPALRKTRDPALAGRMLGGTLTGPVIGMLFFIGSLKYLPAGIVSTITFMTPLLIIPLGAWRYKARFTGQVLLGGAVALVGVALLGWNP